MAASSIPNLNTLRRGERGGLRGALSGRSSQIDKDAVIRSTDDDAASSRISAVEAGYLDDPFAKHLTGDRWQRRLPLMNRGTYVRTTALDRIIDIFLSTSEGSKQIVSLGAGSDTRYLRLKRDKRHSGFTYHELDFRENTRTKIDRLRAPQCSQLIRQLCDIDISTAETADGDLATDEYGIHAIDLRKLPDSLGWLNKDIPTLLISECCLIYLPPQEADRVLSYFSEMLFNAPLAIAIYEPFRPNDAFGRTMIRNLMTRGIVLETIEKYANLDLQRKRLGDHNFSAKAADVDYIWQTWIDLAEKERIDKLEWMDEVEEFVLLAKHYCIAWGWRGFADDAAWQTLQAPA